MIKLSTFLIFVYNIINWLKNRQLYAKPGVLAIQQVILQNYPKNT